MSAPAPERPSKRMWLAMALAWISVGAPLAWGVWMTLRKAAQLFG